MKQWREAVENRQAEVAIDLASQICGGFSPPLIPREIAQLCQSNGVNPEFLNAAFNYWDLQCWYHALFFKRSAREIAAESDANGGPIPKLFSVVSERIEPVEAPKGNILWPYTIWHLKKGVCDRKAWVLCELAYQLGYETQIVYLRHPQTLVSPHTICELRKGEEVWVADPYFGKLLPGKSVAYLATDPNLANDTWPDKKDLREAVKKSAYWLPAYPQDYCPRNQILQDKVKAVLGDDCPRFGEPPVGRLKRYCSLTTEQDKLFPYAFWFYPFRLLHAEMSMMSKQHNAANNTLHRTRAAEGAPHR